MKPAVVVALARCTRGSHPSLDHRFPHRAGRLRPPPWRGRSRSRCRPMASNSDPGNDPALARQVHQGGVGRPRPLRRAEELVAVCSPSSIDIRRPRARSRARGGAGSAGAWRRRAPELVAIASRRCGKVTQGHKAPERPSDEVAVDSVFVGRRLHPELHRGSRTAGRPPRARARRGLCSRWTARRCCEGSRFATQHVPTATSGLARGLGEPDQGLGVVDAEPGCASQATRIEACGRACTSAWAQYGTSPLLARYSSTSMNHFGHGL